MNTEGYQLADGSWSSEYKVGDKFLFSWNKQHKFRQGEVVVYIEDDDSDSPRFMNSSEEKAYCYWSSLSKYKSEESMDLSINTFKKEDLKTGMRVTCRNGEVYVVLLNTTEGDVLCKFDGGFNWLGDYNNEDLIMEDGDCPEYDIIKIQEPTIGSLAKQTSLGAVIWERKEEISPLQKDFDELQSQIKALQEKANTIQQQINN